MSLLLASNRSTLFRIIIPNGASASERWAAEELSHTLNEITGAYFPVEFPFMYRPIDKTNNIIIGHVPEAAKLGVLPDEALGPEGYEIKECGKNLVIAGGKPRGTLYGVFALLEEDFGCRWYTPTLKHIPKRDTLVLSGADRKFRPPLEYRDPYCVYDADWNARNRMNGSSSKMLYSKHGRSFKFCKNLNGHTLCRMIPSDEYFDSHPEYFALIDGKRTKDGQYCLTSPGLLSLVKARAREWLAEDPDASAISISQNDGYSPCECESCKKIDDGEQSYSGSLIWFLNEVAKDLEKDYPDIVISTLAYRYTRPAPKNIKPHPAISVLMCSIESCCGHPLAECDAEPVYPDFMPEGPPSKNPFQRDLQDWAKICGRIHIWDYKTNFAHYCMPFPNLDALKPNIDFYMANSVKGIFALGNYSVGGGPDFNELRSYLLAKLLWNPDCDVGKARSEFMAAYYGKAAPPLSRYLEAIHAKVRDGNIHFCCYSDFNIEYLDDALLSEAEALFDEAEALADNEDVLWRVRRSRMSVKFVRFGRRVVAGLADAREIDAFLDEARGYGITQISEFQTMDLDRDMMVKENRLRPKH